MLVSRSVLPTYAVGEYNLFFEAGEGVGLLRKGVPPSFTTPESAGPGIPLLTALSASVRAHTVVRKP